MPAISPRPEGERAALVIRRWELFTAAAPLFERQGYRGVTVEQLAHACWMSPAGLYHYFPSKAAFALFPLGHANGMCANWRRMASGLPADPLVRLHGLIRFVARYAQQLRLAMRLSREFADDARLAAFLARTVREAREDWIELARSVHPSSTDERVNDFFDALVAIYIGDLPGIVRTTDDLRRQMTDAARGWVVSLGVDPDAFDRAGADPLLREAGLGITPGASSATGRTASAASRSG